MGQAAAVEWVVLDVGETLVDETRVWAVWADVIGVPRFTFAAVLGGLIAQGRDHEEVFDVLGAPAWRERIPAFEAAYGGFAAADLYPDALPALDALRAAGLRVAVVANQPASRRAELLALGVTAEVVAMSEALGVGKPDPAFFARTLALLDDPAPERVAYVGDRVDNDVLPALAAGLRAVRLERGPWGLLQRLPPGSTALVARDLAALPALLGRAG